MAINVTKVIDNVGKLSDSLADLTLGDVLVGVPAEKTPRRGMAITNASLAYIHENGSPARNIPARPFLRPGIRKARPQIIAAARAGALAAIQGEPNAGLKALNKMGLIARNAVVNEITDPEPPFVPLRPATIRNRLRKTQAGRRQLRKLATDAQKAHVSMAAALNTWAAGGNIHPLIDTGQLRASLTYVVRRTVGRA